MHHLLQKKINFLNRYKNKISLTNLSYLLYHCKIDLELCEFAITNDYCSKVSLVKNFSLNKNIIIIQLYNLPTRLTISQLKTLVHDHYQRCQHAPQAMLTAELPINSRLFIKALLQKLLYFTSFKLSSEQSLSYLPAKLNTQHTKRLNINLYLNNMRPVIRHKIIIEVTQHPQLTETLQQHIQATLASNINALATEIKIVYKMAQVDFCGNCILASKMLELENGIV